MCSWVLRVRTLLRAAAADFVLSQPQFGGQPGVEFFTLGWKLPHDMRYPSPEIAVYVRKAQP